jgi:hypothetical protein
MPHHEVVAFWVIERGKAPGVFESDEVRFLRVVVEMHGAEASDLLSCHLRAVDALLQRRRKDCRALAGVALSAETRLPTCGPYQEEASVSSLLEFGHDAVDDVRLGREDVYRVHVPLGRAPLLEALDIWAGQNRGLAQQWAQHTRDVEVEDVIFLDDIVDQLLAVLVNYEYLPLSDALAMVAGIQECVHTSPRVVERMVLRMTARY